MMDVSSVLYYGEERLNSYSVERVLLDSAAGFQLLLPGNLESFGIRFFVEFDPACSAGKVKDQGRIDQRSRRGDAALRERAKIGQPEGTSADFLAGCPRDDIVCRDVGEAVRTTRVLTSLPQFFAETGVDSDGLKCVDHREDNGPVGLLDIPQVRDSVCRDRLPGEREPEREVVSVEHGPPTCRTRNAWNRAVWLEVALEGLEHTERDTRLGPLVHAGSCSVEELGVEPHVRVTVKGNDVHSLESTRDRVTSLILETSESHPAP